MAKQDAKLSTIALASLAMVIGATAAAGRSVESSGTDEKVSERGEPQAAVIKKPASDEAGSTSVHALPVGRSQLWKICTDGVKTAEEAERRLTACTKLIEAGREKTIDLGSAYANRCAMKVYLRKFSDALPDCNRAFALKMPDAWLLTVRGDVLLSLHLENTNSGDGSYLERAIADLDRAITFDPKHHFAHEIRAKAYLAQGNFESAVESFKKAYKSRPLGISELIAEAEDNLDAIMGFEGDDVWIVAAIGAFSAAIDRSPSSGDAFSGRADAYSFLEKYELAIADYTNAIATNPGKAGYYLLRGEIFLELEKAYEAEADFDKAIELDGKMRRAYMVRAAFHAKKLDKQSAIADYSKAIELEPRWTDAYVARANVYMDAFDFEEAIVDFTAAIGLRPDNKEFYFARGQALAKSKKHEGAVADYSKVIEIHNRTNLDGKSDPPEGAYVNRGVELNKLGQTDNAIADFRRALDIKESPQAYNGLGDSYRSVRDHIQALNNYSKAIELDKNFVPAHINRGEVYYNTKKYSPALADFDRAIKLVSLKVPALYFSRGSAHLKLGGLDAALSDFDTVIEEEPNHIAAHKKRADVFYEMEQYQKVIKDLSKVISLSPEDADAYCDRGVSQLLLGKLDKGIADLSRAISLRPKFAKAYARRALAWNAKELPLKEIEDYNSVIELRPQSALAFLRRGEVYESLRKIEEAKQDFEAALRLDPNNEDVLLALDRIGKY